MTETGSEADVERMLDALDVDAVDPRDAKHFRRIIAAREALQAAEDELRMSVAAARQAGDSWTVVGAALDVSRQAAQQRFGSAGVRLADNVLMFPGTPLDTSPPREDDIEEMPLPLAIANPDDAMRAFFPPHGEPPSFPDSPIAAAWLWVEALHLLATGEENTLDVLTALSSNPKDWPDYHKVAAEFEPWALMQHVHYPDEHADLIAYARLMPDTGHTMVAFDEAAIDDYVILTLVKHVEAGGVWLVWGYSRQYTPSPRRIMHGDED